MASLATKAGGWGQLKHGFVSMDDPKYKKLTVLVDASITPREATDRHGMCNRKKCLCKSCFVKTMMRKAN